MITPIYGINKIILMQNKSGTLSPAGGGSNTIKRNVQSGVDKMTSRNNAVQECESSTGRFEGNKSLIEIQ